MAAKRPVLTRLLDDLQPGDVFVVTKLDRLARSTLDLLRVIEHVVQAVGTFKSLGEPWADTTSRAGRLMLSLLGAVAEFERALILERTNEARVRAKARGIRFGRKPTLSGDQAREALRRLEAGESTREIALSYAVAHSTIIRLNTRAMLAFSRWSCGKRGGTGGRVVIASFRAIRFACFTDIGLRTASPRTTGMTPNRWLPMMPNTARFEGDQVDAHLSLSARSRDLLFAIDL